LNKLFDENENLTAEVKKLKRKLEKRDQMCQSLQLDKSVYMEVINK